MMTVSSPVRPRRYARALCERLAGVSSPVRPFERRCPTITSGTPASNACSNGTMSAWRSTESDGTRAAPLCVSEAQPWPGQCLTVERTRDALRPLIQATT